MTSDTPTPDGELSAFFATRPDAERALERLRGAGVAASNLRLTEGADPGDQAEEPAGRRLFHALGEFFTPAPDGQAEGGARDGCIVTVTDIPAERRDMVARLLHEAGGVNVDDSSGRDYRAESDPGEPRAVQPGFADAAPGFVPETAAYPTSAAPGERPDPDEIADSKGRFAEQLDSLPGRQDRDPRSRNE